MAFEKVGALWLKDGKKGKFMAGNITINDQEIAIMVFKNDKGDNEKRPDYTINKKVDEQIQEQPPITNTPGEIPDNTIPF